MASGFSSAEGVCEGDDCTANTDLTFYVKEKKKLCHDCASKKECIGRARKGGHNLYCEKHGKDVDLYCKTHAVALCVSCAMVDHHEKPCVRQDIEDAIMENKAELKILKKKVMEKLELYRVHGNHIGQCRQSADEHLQSIKDEVDSVIEKAIARDQARKQEDATKIDQEIDRNNQKLQEEILVIQEKIRKNNNKRKKRYEKNNTNAENRQEPINNKRCDLHADIQNIAEEIERKIGELDKSWQDDTKSTENANRALDTVLGDDQNIVKDGHRVNTSVRDTLERSLNEDEVEKINRVVSGVMFVKGAGREMMYDGRIDGYDGKWTAIDEINVGNEIKVPYIIGCIDECNVILTDNRLDRMHTYMLDLNTKHTQRVIDSSSSSWVFSCAVLNDDKVVCGKASKVIPGDSLNGCISVYDRRWKLINDITIPRNTTGEPYTVVDVAADKDGMIIAAEVSQSKIYVINPADGKIINTITCKENIRLRGMLSSGHMIGQPTPSDCRVLIIDNDGTHSEISHSNYTLLNSFVDPKTDDLYVVTSANDFDICVIDQVMSENDIRHRTALPLSKEPLDRNGKVSHIGTSRVIMTSSGNVIASDRENILIFKKLFSL